MYSTVPSAYDNTCDATSAGFLITVYGSLLQVIASNYRKTFVDSARGLKLIPQKLRSGHQRVRTSHRAPSVTSCGRNNELSTSPHKLVEWDSTKNFTIPALAMVKLSPRSLRLRRYCPALFRTRLRDVIPPLGLHEPRAAKGTHNHKN